MWALHSRLSGLSYFLVDITYSKEEAAVSFPFEYLPLPEEGARVNAVNRAGKVVCQATVIKVQNPAKCDYTPVITVVIPKTCY